VIGAHLGSLEHDLGEIARRLARYPNFLVDTSARLLDLALKDPESVRRLFLRYQDRILYGTDIVAEQSQAAVPEVSRRSNLEFLRRTYASELAFLQTTERLELWNRSIRGLGLPEKVVEKIVLKNAGAIYAI